MPTSTIARLAPLVLAGLALLSPSLRADAVARLETSPQQLVWKPVRMGAGGYVTGIDLHADGTMLVRTDVGGAYIRDNKKGEWIQVVTTYRLPPDTLGFFEYTGVSSIVAAPSRTQRLYLAFAGRLFSSDNSGANWRLGRIEGLDRLPMEPNARVGRHQGERLAVDPSNPDIVYYGSNQNGLWRSADGGATWKQVPLDQVPAGQPAPRRNPGDRGSNPGVGTVNFDPSSGTVSGRTKRIFATVWGEGVYESTDGGATWARSGAEFDMTRIESAAIALDGTFVVAQQEKKGVYLNRGGSWQRLKLPREDDWQEVVIKPDNSQVIFVFGGGIMQNRRHFRSTDGGQRWTGIAHSRLVAEDIPWLVHEAWFSTAAIKFMPGTEDLWIAQGVGVWTTKDAMTGTELTWHSRSAGIEELVVTDIVVPAPGQPLISNWDRAVIKMEHVDRFPSTYGPTLDFNSGWDLDVMAGRPSTVVGVFQAQSNNPKRGAAFSGYSDDGGRTWTPFGFKTFPFDVNNGREAVYGMMAVSSQHPEKIIWSTVGSRGRFLYTHDRGDTWQDSEFEGNISGGSWNERYHFMKNALVGDPLEGDTFYAYHAPTKTLFRSTDGGRSFQVRGKVPSTRGDFHCKLRARPGVSGHLFFTAGFNNHRGSDDGMGPLFESRDGGATWTRVPGTERIIDIAFGAPAPGRSNPTYYVNGQIRGPAGPVRGIFQSIDEGATWQTISGPYPMGISKGMSNLAADPGIFGRVYIGTTGVGAFYGDLPSR